MNDMQLRRKKEQRHGNQEEKWLEGAESALTLHKCIPGIESGRFGRYCMGQPSQNKRRNTCISVSSLAYSMGNPSLAWRRDRPTIILQVKDNGLCFLMQLIFIPCPYYRHDFLIGLAHLHLPPALHSSPANHNGLLAFLDYQVLYNLALPHFLTIPPFPTPHPSQ